MGVGGSDQRNRGFCVHVCVCVPPFNTKLQAPIILSHQGLPDSPGCPALCAVIAATLPFIQVSVCVCVCV